MNLQAVREALADAITNGVQRPLNVYAYMPASPAFPCAVITPADDYISVHDTFGVNQLVELHYEILIGTQSRAEDAQILLDELLSFGDDEVSSIVDVLEAERNPATGALGGLVEDLCVMTARAIGQGDVNAEVFTASIHLMVLVRR